MITYKPSNSVSHTYNEILERIHQVLVNLVLTFNITKTYVDEDDPWSEILAAAEFVIISKINRLRGYSTGQLVFGLNIIILIKHKVVWELIRQRKHLQIKNIISAKIIKELTTTTKSEIKSC